MSPLRPLPPGKKRVLFWIGVVAAAPAVIMVLAVSYFVVSTELAHEESRCPYHVVEERQLDDDVAVRDEGRRCQEGVEEHRWSVIRSGGSVREIGRRRLPRVGYGEGYSFAAELDDAEVRIVVHNPGFEDLPFRDGGERAP